MKTKHFPETTGIFVQRNLEYKGNVKRTKKPFCVTFPRLANLGHGDNEALFTSDDFNTFEEAHKFAIQMKKIDSRLRNCPIFLLDFKWIKSSTKRELQRVG